ncbi:hypothetical protein KL925_001397 [Ogataea polymorpha]|nr:hypothetical protein KL925_001397 [Ogataea polymorpha]
MAASGTTERHPNSAMIKLGKILGISNNKNASGTEKTSPATSSNASLSSSPSSPTLQAKITSDLNYKEAKLHSNSTSSLVSSNIGNGARKARSPGQSSLQGPGNIAPISLNSGDAASLSRSGSMASKNPQVARFLMREDGTHEHHLRNTKRQEKLGQMVKDWLGAKKLRNSAVSAIPNILSSTNLAALDNEAKARVDAATSKNLPPTLLSGLLNQVKRGDITQFSGPENAIQQPSTAMSVNMKPEAADNRLFVEKYGECQEVIGRGAFGVVRVAHKKVTKDGSDGSTEILYAVKEFRRRPNESDKRYSKRLTSEFCISSSLKHLNIISTIDLLKDAKSDYCEVMEYCSGGDLYSLIVTAGRLEYTEADCFFKQLVRGLNYMHKMGVAHRDLKPENLLLTSEGTLKITDFGNAECFKMAWEDEVQLSHGICGSSPYIAPEEYTQKEFDPRPIDVWACGVIYMAMRTGRQLWKLANVEDEFFTTYLQKRKDAKGYEPIEGLKRARCRNVIYSVLDPIPQRRITCAQILNSEWVREIKVCKAGDCGKRVE